MLYMALINLQDAFKNGWRQAVEGYGTYIANIFLC
jgi:hypothetical protein